MPRPWHCSACVTWKTPKGKRSLSFLNLLGVGFHFFVPNRAKTVLALWFFVFSAAGHMAVFEADLGRGHSNPDGALVYSRIDPRRVDAGLVLKLNVGLPRFHYRERGKTVVRVVSEVKSSLEMVEKEAQEWGSVPGRWWCRSVGLSAFHKRGSGRTSRRRFPVIFGVVPL